MQVTGKTIDDFKTDRKDITPPLPILLRLVPLLLYCAIALAVILNTIFFIQFRLAAQKLDGHTSGTAALQAQVADSRNQRTALEVQIKKATDIEAWVESSRPLQPLAVQIARSIGEGSSIVDLHLDRDPDSPSQIRLSMRLSTDSIKQLDTTLEKIAAQKYRVFSPQQSMGRGEIDYKTTLVWQDPLRDANILPATSGTNAKPAR